MDILNKKEFSPNTLSVYKSVIKRLDKLGFNFPLNKKEDLAYVTKFFDAQFPKVGTRLDALNIIIVLRQIESLPVDKFKALRQVLFNQRVNENVPKMNTVGDSLPTMDDVKIALKQAYDDGKWKTYIINFLFLKYGCRNMDIDVIIANEAGEDSNFLIPHKDGVTYVRNKYKTCKTYGPITSEITDPHFMHAVEQVGKGKLFNSKQLINAIRPHRLLGLTESKLFKLLVDEAFKNKDVVELNRLSKSRGTSMGVIRQFYNVNATEDLFREL